MKKIIAPLLVIPILLFGACTPAEENKAVSVKPVPVKEASDVSYFEGLDFNKKVNVINVREDNYVEDESLLPKEIFPQMFYIEKGKVHLLIGSELPERSTENIILKETYVNDKLIDQEVFYSEGDDATLRLSPIESNATSNEYRAFINEEVAVKFKDGKTTIKTSKGDKSLKKGESEKLEETTEISNATVVITDYGEKQTKDEVLHEVIENITIK